MSAMGQAATVSFYFAVGGQETCLDPFVIALLAGSLKISNNSLIVASGVDHSEGLLLRHHADAIPSRRLVEGHKVLATPDIRRRLTISGSTRPLGSTRHCIPSEARPSAVPPPPARRFGGASSADAANPQDRFYTTGLGNASADPLVDRGMASLARTGRPWKWQRSEPIAPSRVISFGRRPSRN